MRMIGGTCVLLLAVACAGADQETEYAVAARQIPVDVRPGLYSVRLGGSTVVELNSGTRTDEVCLDSVDALQFPTDPLGPTIERWENCSKQLNQLKGNAMRGARLCVARAVPMIARYTGTHTRDSFKVVGAVSQGTDETASVMRLGSGDLSIIGRRIGDCSS